MRLVPPSDHLEQARRDVESGKWNEAMDEIMAKSTEELKELYLSLIHILLSFCLSLRCNEVLPAQIADCF